MGCRKAAYRGMVEMSEWMEEQAEQKAATLEAMEKKQREIWTPNDIYEQCCTLWLVRGSFGCPFGSTVCGKAHPRITLGFQEYTETTITNSLTSVVVASLSHGLDPFLKYFDSLCCQDKATKSKTPLTYFLYGFLSTHISTLSTQFGSHFIEVKATALAASRKAHKRQMDQDEEEGKKRQRRKQGALTSCLLERVLDVCYYHCLLEHLDWVEIAWMMSSGCKPLVHIAERMASKRLQQVRLTYSVLVNGHHSTSIDNNDEGHVFSSLSQRHEWYTVIASRLPLFFAEKKELFVPTISTDRFLFGRKSTQEDEHNQLGHLIRIYLEDGSASNSQTPEHNFLFARNDFKTKPLEVARYRIGSCGILETHPNIIYRIVEPSLIESDNTSVAVNNNDDSALQENNDSSLVSLSLEGIPFDFQDLFGIYVRKKLRHAKQNLQFIAQNRPVTRAEKEYVKALAKAAREAPRNARDFQQWQGW